MQPAVLHPHDHAVTFYDRDADLVADVARFAADGLNAGESVLLVATAAHCAAIDAAMADHGYDAQKLRLNRRYIVLDAAETLDWITIDGAPDEEQFKRRMGTVIDAAASDGCRVRIFGEMVTLMWDAGDVAGAIQLEDLWNSLSQTQEFSLLCGYPTSTLRRGSITDATRVCDAHSTVAPPRGYAANASDVVAAAGPIHVSDVFLPTPAAVPAARRFVIASLLPWAASELIETAELVASEFASNAVNHAASAFRVHLAQSERTLRVTVRDVGVDRPQLRDAATDEPNGRGLAITSRLASAWGCDLVAEGKQVWAEIDLDD